MHHVLSLQIIHRETCKLGLMISITAPHITLTNEPLAVQLYAMLRSHPAACLSSCFIIHQSFAMRINNITYIWFALYLLRWTLVQSSTYDTLLELVDQQVHHGKSTDGSRLLPKQMLLLWFQLMCVKSTHMALIFVSYTWYEVVKVQVLKLNHQNLDSDFRI